MALAISAIKKLRARGYEIKIRCIIKGANMKKIHCEKCHKYLGEIRDATLRKGIVYTCSECAKPKYDFASELFANLRN